MQATLRAALEYHGLGLAVFPLPYGLKADTVAWGTYRYAPPDEREVKALFDGKPCNVAAICGTASQNLLELDCDTPAAYTETKARLEAQGIRTLTVRRPPNGSEHDGGGAFVLRTPEPIQSTTIDGIDIRGEGEYFLLPPSLHPGGTIYYTETPPPIFTLPTLTAISWLDLQAAQPPTRPKRRLPALAWRILAADSGTLGGYPSRSEAEQGLCNSLARAGYSYHDALRLLLAYPGPGKFAELHQQNPRDAMRYLGRTWANAERWIAENDSKAGEMAQELTAWALSRPWPGITGSTDRAVYLAHLDIVKRCGRDPHGASVRELAELAGIHRNTAASANRRLADAGLIELAQEATPSCSRLWRVCISVTLHHNYCDGVSSSCASHYDGVSQLCTDHDAFRRRGLNKSGAEVLGALLSVDEASVKELAKMTGRHKTTVRRKLADMLGLGLVEPLGDGYWRVVDNPDLDRAAEEMNTVGMGEEQRKRHVRQRRLHRLTLKRG